MNRDQSPIEYVIGSEFTSMAELLVIFAIPAFKLRYNDIVAVLRALCITCIIIYLAQYLLHIPLISTENKIAEQDLAMRVRINGQCLFPLLYFYSLHILFKRWNWGDFVLVLLSLFCIIIIGFRSHLAVLAVLTIVFMWRKTNVNGRFILYGIFFVSFLAMFLQTSVVQYKINQMVERNEEGNFENDDYVRYRTLFYYTKVAPRNVADKILGIGLPNANSTYGKKIQQLKSYGIIWSDWGLIGLVWVLGVPGVLCIIWYSLKAFLTPMRLHMSYLCYWFLFLLLASIITREIYRVGAFPIQAVVLYLIAKYRRGNAKLDFKQIWKRR